MMKKMLFLMLFLMILGAANVSSQVRIGGNEQPNLATVLDLNASDTTNNGTRGLALPRVALESTASVPTGMTTPVVGLAVYNTATAGSGATAVIPGIYYWADDAWNSLGAQSGTTGLDGWVIDSVVTASVTLKTDEAGTHYFNPSVTTDFFPLVSNTGNCPGNMANCYLAFLQRYGFGVWGALAWSVKGTVDRTITWEVPFARLRRVSR